VGTQLAKAHPLKVVIVGGGQERGIADRVAMGLNGNAVNMAGQTTPLQLAAILRGSCLLLTNDTGPMHVADAVGTPIVAIFGPTDPVTTSPSGNRHTLVRQPMDCSPCLQRVCPLGHHRCMTEVTVEQVAAAAEAWLR
jgi:heptosyltransferase-2